jgi:hypothetical protein
MVKRLPRPSATIRILHDDDSIVGEEDDQRPGSAGPPPAPIRTSHPAIPPAIEDRVRRQLDARGRSAGESIARFLYFVSGALIAAAVSVFGGQIWRQARQLPPPTAAVAPRAAAATMIAPDGRIELGADRRTVMRLAGEVPRWTAPQPTTFDAIAITGPLVLGHARDAIVALDLESGRTRFTWALPANERWGAQPPVALATCLLPITTRSAKAVVRCLDLATGAVRWTAAPAAAHDCTQPLLAVRGAYLLQCPGWTAVIDDRTGAVSVEAGGIGLIQDDPPYLLRARPRLTLAPWSSARRRFTTTGEVAVPASTAIGSAVLRKDRLVIRAVESSDELATILPRSGPPVTIAAPVYRLADARPLTRSCGGTTAPRFQLLELTPRIGATFDPATTQDRALALLDVESGTLAWTSRKLTGLHVQGTEQGTRQRTGPVICRGGHYLLPLEVPDRTHTAASMLWIVDAETGKTAAVLAFDADMDASFARLAADQIDDQRMVGLGRNGAFELRWQPPGHGLHDARRELEAALGPLP